MKKLLLMRHAAANAQLLESDLTRTLSNMGIAEIKEAKEFIADIKIDKILFSPSTRTMQTKEFLCSNIQSIQMEVKEELYAASAETILDIIQAENDKIESLLVIAHNPAIYQLALQISNKNQDNYELLIDNSMPTCCIIELNFENIAKWLNIEKNSGKILKIFIPSN